MTNRLYQALRAVAVADRSAPAIIDDDGVMTYGELLEAVDAAAARLEPAVGTGPIALLIPRSRQLCIAEFAAIGLGVPFLPLDPIHPPSRLRYMTHKARCTAIVTAVNSTRLTTEIIPDGSQVATVRLEGPSFVANGSVTHSSLADPFAVLFTSGSTGRPLGVQLSAPGFLNRLAWAQQQYPLDRSDRVLHAASPSFDFSLWEIFATIMSGAALVIAHPESGYDPAYLVDLLRAEAVTVAHFVPSVLALIADHPRLSLCDTIRLLLVGGEAFSGHLYRRVAMALPAAVIYNQYGPTEASIDVTAFRCESERITGDNVPVGEPISGAILRILGADGSPVKDGIPGELHVGGIGLAHGYVDEPELTAARFWVSDDAGPPTRFFRTGDLVRVAADGSLIEFLGRTDEQVKIRGVRVEPAEIAAVLFDHPVVRDVIVLPISDHDTGEIELVAFVAADESVVTPEELRSFIAQALPPSMRPRTVVIVDDFPRQPGGKIDRVLLKESYDPPRGQAWDGDGGSDTLVRLADIWSDVLSIPRPRPDADFFELGGHSLMAVQVVSRIEQELNVTVPLQLIFETASLAELSEAVTELRRVVLQS